MRTILLVVFMFLILAALCGYVVYLSNKIRNVLMSDDKLKTTLTSSDIQNIQTTTRTLAASIIGAWVLVGLIGVGTIVDYVKSSSNGGFSGGGFGSASDVSADLSNP